MQFLDDRHAYTNFWLCSKIIANGDFISTCADVGGGWRRIAKIDISAGDDCPGEWRKATQSGISFCRVASDDEFETCYSANFSTNGISYQRVCGRTRGYQKGDTITFWGSHFRYNRGIDQSYVDGLSITYSSNPRQHIWTFAYNHLPRNRSLVILATIPLIYMYSTQFCCIVAT